MNRDILSKIEQEQMISREGRRAFGGAGRTADDNRSGTDRGTVPAGESDSREILWKRDLPEGADRIYQLL